VKLVLPSGHVALIDDADAPLLEGRNWYADRRSNTTYVRGRATWRDVAVYLHNIIMGGPTDHKNGDGLDCRRQNLRLATQAQNGLNKAAKHGKKFKGVYPSRGKFYAELYFQRVRYASHGHLTEEAAARAYDALARQHHGEFARVNFP